MRSRAYLAHEDFVALQQSFCKHVACRDADPMATGWPRGLLCLYCNMLVDYGGYERDETGIYRPKRKTVTS
jgi:hypothetical protein